MINIGIIKLNKKKYIPEIIKNKKNKEAKNDDSSFDFNHLNVYLTYWRNINNT